MEPRKYKFNNSTLTIVFGDILTSKAEVIVSSDDTGISMGSGISGCIRKAGGDGIREDAQKKLPAQLGDVVVSTAGELEYQKFIFHCLTCNEHQSDNNNRQLANTKDKDDFILNHSVDKCLRLLQSLDLSSIAFPCIGAGGAHIPMQEVAEIMSNKIPKFLCNSHKHYEIELYIHDSNVNDELRYLGFNVFFDNRLKQTENANYICNEELYDDVFFIYLTIEGTSYEEVEMVADNPNKTIRDQIANMVRVFELPKMDNGGNPVQYLLGRIIEEDNDPEILEFEDEYGREQCLMDYNVQPGDHLHLISVPIAGGRPNPMKTAYKPARRSFLQRLFRIKENRVYSSVFAPHKVCRCDSMMIQVFVYKDRDYNNVMWEALHCDEKTSERAYNPLNFQLKQGDSVKVNLRMQGIEVERARKAFVWQDDYSKVCFYVTIPRDWEGNVVYGEVFLSVNNAILGELNFMTEIVKDYPQCEETTQVSSRQFKKIFISYAHQDESKVQYIARAYEAQGVDYFFDRDYLKPGDIFPLKIKEYIDSADLFILCWSANAAQSEYVDIERKQALKRAYPRIKPIEKAPLSIYPMSIEPQAELPADMRDTYNFIEMNRKPTNDKKLKYVI